MMIVTKKTMNHILGIMFEYMQDNSILLTTNGTDRWEIIDIQFGKVRLMPKGMSTERIAPTIIKFTDLKRYRLLYAWEE